MSEKLTDRIECLLPYVIAAILLVIAAMTMFVVIEFLALVLRG